MLWVFGDNCVDKDNKYCKGHAKYTIDKEGKYEEFKIDYAQGEVTGKEVTDVVHISDKLAIPDQLIGAAGYVNEEYEGYDGIMGWFDSELHVGRARLRPDDHFPKLPFIVTSTYYWDTKYQLCKVETGLS